MAERRMFAKTIVTSDAFLDLPATTRCLYFLMAMLADDDGFVNAPKSVMRQAGASLDDMNLLIAKRYVLTFESGVVVIKHWKIHNLIQNDRYKETTYLEEKAQLTLDQKKGYIEVEKAMDPLCIQNGSKMDPQVSIGKLSLVKDSIITTTTTDAPSYSTVYLYFKENLDEGAVKEAGKFYAYNEAKGWSCLPHWKATADLWIARIDEKQGGHK